MNRLTSIHDLYTKAKMDERYAWLIIYAVRHLCLKYFDLAELELAKDALDRYRSEEIILKTNRKTCECLINTINYYIPNVLHEINDRERRKIQKVDFNKKYFPYEDKCSDLYHKYADWYDQINRFYNENTIRNYNISYNSMEQIRFNNHEDDHYSERRVMPIITFPEIPLDSNDASY